jgi:hypothetical protein
MIRQGEEITESHRSNSHEQLWMPDLKEGWESLSSWLGFPAPPRGPPLRDGMRRAPVRRPGRRVWPMQTPAAPDTADIDTGEVGVQTFVPYADFASTARVLDTQRLGKQRVEVIQIVRALTVPGYAWATHPAVLMWKGHEEALGRYGLSICEEWCRRGHADTCAGTIAADLARAGVGRLRTYPELLAAGALPAWLFDESVQRSHRSALVRKDPDHYAGEFPDVDPAEPYVWPVRSEAVLERERRRAAAAERRAVRQREASRRRRSAAARKGWQARRQQEGPAAP